MAEFNKKYWQKHRQSVAEGSGVGKALDAWVKDVPDNPADADSAPTYKALKAAIAGLREALETARSKCKPANKYTKTIELIDDYEKDITAYEKKVAKDYERRVDEFTEQRRGYCNLCIEYAKTMAKYLKEMKVHDEKMDELEEFFLDQVSTGSDALGDHAVNGKRLLDMAEETADEAIKYYKTVGVKIAAMRTVNPGQTGVDSKDVGQATKSFHEGTDHSKAATDTRDQINLTLEGIRDAFKEMARMAKEGPLGGDEVAKRLEQLVQSIEPMFKGAVKHLLTGNIDERTVSIKKSLQEKDSLDEKALTNLKIDIARVVESFGRFSTQADGVIKKIAKELKRLPKDVMRSRVHKPKIDQFRMFGSQLGTLKLKHGPNVKLFAEALPGLG